MKPSIFLVVAVLAHAVPAAAQIDGHISAMVNLFPDPDPTPGRQEVTELRTRIFLEHQSDVGSWFRIHLSGYADGLVRRGCCSSSMRTAAIARPSDAYIELRGSWFDFRVGASRIVWGRLDEFQPTDVVNPIDLSRFLLEGRSEARLPVGLLRARLHFGGAATLEVIGVPVFRASRFDQLDEPTSPFNLATTVPPAVVIERQEPEFRRENFQGGGRLTATTARVDWGLSAYRGIRTFPTVTLLQTVAPPTTLLETFPYFTMVGADFETVRGPWGVRGEAAYFVDDTIQATSGNPRGIEGRSAEGGFGVDRRAGDYRVAGNVLVSWNTLSDPEVSVVAAADRSFSRETRTLRAFAIYNTADRTLFGRVIAAISLRDNLWLEGSGGLFTGSSLDPLGRLTRRDFFYTRLKLFL